MTHNRRFPETAPSANPVFYRTYSRFENGLREDWESVCDRNYYGFLTIDSSLTAEERQLLYQQQLSLKYTPAGRCLWVLGTEWAEQPENVYGLYNCSSTNVVDWKSFALLMDLAMQGCGTGAVLERKYINQLPPICNRLEVEITDEIGSVPVEIRQDSTVTIPSFGYCDIIVGDSRQGWVEAYLSILELASSRDMEGYDKVRVKVSLGNVRPKGEKLKGFGGVANPDKLPDLFTKVAAILNGAIGRQLTPEECCKLIDEASVVVVAGNVRRSAGIRQFDAEDPCYKMGLYWQDEQGNWHTDLSRECMRVANHTRVFHHKPSLEECIESARLQHKSGEGALMWAGEAVARANRDILNTSIRKERFLSFYDGTPTVAGGYLQQCYFCDTGKYLPPDVIEYRLSLYGGNPCFEILGSNFFCDLGQVHLDQIDPLDIEGQKAAFRAAGLSVAILLHHKFPDERYQKSRELDPIVAVTFTGFFDFCVKTFGRDWLLWWEAGRPEDWDNIVSFSLDLIDKVCSTFGIDDNDPLWMLPDGLIYKELERRYLQLWRDTAHQAVWDYCDSRGLKRPNRCTAIQPSGTKSLLTGASPAFYPPKATRFIRRITFAKNDPVALACLDYGYSVVPGQADKDEDGKLLTDPFDPRVTEWLVEIPTEVSWADVAEGIDVANFPIEAQWDFSMQVQNYYTTHNTSNTLEVAEHEVEKLGELMYNAIQNNEGYVSFAVLARDTSTFPRMPYERISQEEYLRLTEEVKQRQKSSDFYALLIQYDRGQQLGETGPMGCDSDRCLIGERK